MRLKHASDLLRNNYMVKKYYRYIHGSINICTVLPFPQNLCNFIHKFLEVFCLGLNAMAMLGMPNIKQNSQVKKCLLLCSLFPSCSAFVLPRVYSKFSNEAAMLPTTLFQRPFSFFFPSWGCQIKYKTVL